MKKILLLSTLIAFFSLGSTAQIKKGATLLGGQISFNNSDIDWNTPQPNQESRSGVYHITAGKAFKENAVFGLYAEYAHNKVEAYSLGSALTYKIDIYNAGVFYRKFHKLAKDFYFFGEISTGYMGSKENNFVVSGTAQIKRYQSGVELNLTPGLSYRVYKKLHIELSIRQLAGMHYTVTKTKSPADNSKVDSFGFNTNMNGTFLEWVSVGFRFVL